MQDLTRRAAIGVSLFTGPLILAAQIPAEAAGDKDVIFADEKPVLLKIRNVTLESVDQAGRTISASFGNQAEPITLANVPLGDDFSIRMSFVFPSMANNLPFTWDRLKDLVGKRVSIMFRAEASKLSVNSIASGND